MKLQYFTLLLALSLMFFNCESAEKETTQKEEKVNTSTIYVGTYTRTEGHVDGKATGIYQVEMNTETGALSIVDTITGTINPSYLTIHPNQKYLYAVNEIADGNRIGMITAYNIENGKKEKLNEVSSKGDAPCFISVDATGKFVLVANYMETVASYKIEADGSLSEAISVIEHKREKKAEFRQETGHPHTIAPAMDDKTVFVSDLGLDQVLHYELDEKGTLSKVAITEITPLSGPRHLAFHPTNGKCYVLNELNVTVETFTMKAANEPFERIQAISTLGDIDENVSPSAIKIHPSGKFLYTANRGINGGNENSITIFEIEEDGTLSFVSTTLTGGEVPRDFEISPDGRFLLAANQNSNSIVTFKINEGTGTLEATEQKLEIKTPVCVKFLK
jgi:6-phosphogluconolactonase